MTKITISYRREDSGIITGRIFDRLVAHYGTDTVFRDIDNIPPGIDYRKYINECLNRTDILLAIIGPDWAGKTPDGRTRIAEPTDLVRIEVEVALQKDIPVVPVLVANATMPQPNELPEALHDFAYRNAVKVDALEDFDDHVRRLTRNLDRLLKSKGVLPSRTEVPKEADRERDEPRAVNPPQPVIRIMAQVFSWALIALFILASVYLILIGVLANASGDISNGGALIIGIVALLLMAFGYIVYSKSTKRT